MGPRFATINTSVFVPREGSIGKDTLMGVWVFGGCLRFKPYMRRKHSIGHKGGTLSATLAGDGSVPLRYGSYTDHTQAGGAVINPMLGSRCFP